MSSRSPGTQESDYAHQLAITSSQRLCPCTFLLSLHKLLSILPATSPSIPDHVKVGAACSHCSCIYLRIAYFPLFSQVCDDFSMLDCNIFTNLLRLLAEQPSNHTIPPFKIVRFRAFIENVFRVGCRFTQNPASTNYYYVILLIHCEKSSYP